MMFESLHPSFGDGWMGGATGCLVDQIERPCSETTFMLNMGIAEHCTNDYCGPRVMTNGVEERLVPMTRDPDTGELGYFTDLWDGQRKKNKAISKQRIEEAINACLGNYGMVVVSFDASAKGKNGSALVNTVQGELEGSHARFRIINDATSHNAKELGVMHAKRTGQYEGPNKFYPSALGFTGRPGNINGVSLPPNINYTANDREDYFGDNTDLEDLVGRYAATQIHELGNSLSLIARNSLYTFGDPNAKGDKDSGAALAKCATKELKK